MIGEAGIGILRNAPVLEVLPRTPDNHKLVKTWPIRDQAFVFSTLHRFEFFFFKKKKSIDRSALPTFTHRHTCRNDHSRPLKQIQSSDDKLKIQL